MSGSVGVTGVQNRPAVQVFNQTMPASGQSRALPFQVSLIAGVVYEYSIQNQQVQGVIDQIQSMWVDNQTNTTDLIITTGAILQTLTIPAGMQGYVPLLVTNPPNLTMLTASNATVFFLFLNVPMPIGLWNTTGTETAFTLPAPGNNATFAADDSSGANRIALPAGGGRALNIRNVTKYEAFIEVGDDTVTATAGGSASSSSDGSFSIPGGTNAIFTMPNGATHFVACCFTGESTTLRLTVGEGQ